MRHCLPAVWRWTAFWASGMATVADSDDQIFGPFVVELVDFEAPVEHGNIPLEQVDEHALARFEHRLERRLCIGAGSRRGLP